jgi:hypothetical protein
MTRVGGQRRDGPGPKTTTSHDVGLVGPRRASNGMICAILESAASRTCGFESVVRRERSLKATQPSEQRRSYGEALPQSTDPRCLRRCADAHADGGSETRENPRDNLCEAIP